MKTYKSLSSFIKSNALFSSIGWDGTRINFHAYMIWLIYVIDEKFKSFFILYCTIEIKIVTVLLNLLI